MLVTIIPFEHRAAKSSAKVYAEVAQLPTGIVLAQVCSVVTGITAEVPRLSLWTTESGGMERRTVLRMFKIEHEVELVHARLVKRWLPSAKRCVFMRRRRRQRPRYAFR